MWAEMRARSGTLAKASLSRAWGSSAARGGGGVAVIGGMGPVAAAGAGANGSWLTRIWLLTLDTPDTVFTTARARSASACVGTTPFSETAPFSPTLAVMVMPRSTGSSVSRCMMSPVRAVFPWAGTTGNATALAGVPELAWLNAKLAKASIAAANIAVRWAISIMLAHAPRAGARHPGRAGGCADQAGSGRGRREPARADRLGAGVGRSPAAARSARCAGRGPEQRRRRWERGLGGPGRRGRRGAGRRRRGRGVRARPRAWQPWRQSAVRSTVRARKARGGFEGGIGQPVHA